MWILKFFFTLLLISFLVWFYVGLSEEIVSLESEIIKHTERLKGCKEYSLFKQATIKIGSRVYEKDIYDCVHFSKDLVKELEEVGIKSSIAINKERTHAWVLVWIEATTGEFISPKINAEILEIRDKNMKVICTPKN